MRLYLSALGAKIGDDAIISELEFGAIDLVTIGAGASLGTKLKLANARVDGDELIIGTIEIGADAYVGTSCVIEETCRHRRGRGDQDLTSIAAGGRIDPHEIWDGSPARKMGLSIRSTLDAPAQAGDAAAPRMTFVYTCCCWLIPPLGLLPIFPAFWVFDRIEIWLGIRSTAPLSRGHSALRLADRLCAGAASRSA